MESAINCLSVCLWRWHALLVVRSWLDGEVFYARDASYFLRESPFNRGERFGRAIGRLSAGRAMAKRIEKVNEEALKRG